MQPIEYNTNDDFANLLHALRQNKSIRCLDLARVSIPIETEEVTCKAFGELFSTNETLVWLDISGEESRLEATRLGKGLVQALRGLQKNKGLKTLIVQHQQLGLEGMEILGEVLQANTSLQELVCDYNDVSLHGFTTLVNAMARNQTITYLPAFGESRETQLNRTEEEIRAARSKPDGKVSSAHGKIGSMRRTFAKIGSGESGDASHASKPPTPVSQWSHQDAREALQIVSDRWEEQVIRLAGFLDRNRKIADGLVSADRAEAKVSSYCAAPVATHLNLHHGPISTKLTRYTGTAPGCC